MDKKFSNYKLLEQLSENDIFQAWMAEIDGQRVFLKLENTGSELNPATRRNLIRESILSQNIIKTKYIITGRTAKVTASKQNIQYPYFDNNIWQAITPALFIGNIKTILPHIFLISDYLHDLGLVHADLKLNQFLIKTNDDDFDIRLGDLDFLRREQKHRSWFYLWHAGPHRPGNQEQRTGFDPIRRLFDRPLDRIVPGSGGF